MGISMQNRRLMDNHKERLTKLISKLKAQNSAGCADSTIDATYAEIVRVREFIRYINEQNNVVGLKVIEPEAYLIRQPCKNGLNKKTLKKLKLIK
jgi:hypothetical protein